MATACTNCGHDLPRDDAHFCNSCGILVPSHPFSAQSLSAANSAVSTTRIESEKPVLREQMVQHPRSRTTRRIAPDNISASSIAWPAPITHVSVKDTTTQKEDEHKAPQVLQPPVQNLSSSSASAERALHVKVWESPPTPLPESTIEVAEGDVEDAPTSPLATPYPLNTKNLSSQPENATPRDGVEHADTVPMPNYAPTQTPQQAPHLSRSLHSNTHLPALPSEQQRQTRNINTPIPDLRMSQQPAPLSQAPQYSPAPKSQLSYAPLGQEKSVPVTATSSSLHRRKSPVPFIILLALLGVLVLGGGAWVLLAQPFNISPVTQPLQDFNDAPLGVALSYPNSWTVQHTSTGVIFADSSHTAQVKLMVADTTSDVARYVQQQATKTGMTAIKPLGTLAFAGLSWQQIQGNVQQDGANYTTTMLATMHSNHMYILTQMAPQNVYADEESVVFSAIRNSFKFN